MKFPLLTSLLSLWVGVILSTLHADVSVGDRYFEVVEALGEPTGYIGSDDFQIYYFERGEVTFRDGVVESHSILPEEEALRRREDVAREREERQEREQEARRNRIAEGLAIKEEKTSDPTFNARPASARLAFWRVFRQKYPNVDIDLEYSLAYQEARIERAEQMAEAERDRRLNELEQRVMEAEYQAREAEREAERARRPYYADSYVYSYPHRPVVVRPHHPHHKEKKPREQPDEVVVRQHTEIEPAPEMLDRLSPENFAFPPLKDNR